MRARRWARRSARRALRHGRLHHDDWRWQCLLRQSCGRGRCSRGRLEMDRRNNAASSAGRVPTGRSHRNSQELFYRRHVSGLSRNAVTLSRIVSRKPVHSSTRHLTRLPVHFRVHFRAGKAQERSGYVPGSTMQKTLSLLPSGSRK
jgi:hypothetical protein